ncbi:hypothetical protein AAFF_G00168670 [Aldrovandia affinis]|uniref:ribonuclease H n=1 Tax=Aldrovandia affinis TaxID=143900 RepID=A0AAD7RM76_9TELE|nr:hypothetical protein AAFF_G00168670 [Aldrovandia affinis]
MPFGIKPAAEEYQRRQHEVLQGLRGVSVIADDILVYGSGEATEEAVKDHDNNISALLQRAREVNLKLNKRKLRLKLQSVTYMGHLLTTEGLHPDPEKVTAVQNMQTPTDVKSLQRLLGFVNYLSRFLPYLSDVCEPLRRLTDKDIEWAWLPQHDAALENIKHLVMHHPVLKYYDFKEEVTLQCDSNYWEIDELADYTSATVIDCCKTQFSRHWIPHIVFTDNGPPFSGMNFQLFAQEWDFNHETSSPYNSQSNGKAESAVKIAKTLLKKAALDGGDPWKAVLAWRNTPTEGLHSSPVERLMSRRTRTFLPTRDTQLKPKVVKDVITRKQTKGITVKHRYDTRDRDMPTIIQGQTVRVLQQPRQHMDTRHLH